MHRQDQRRVLGQQQVLRPDLDILGADPLDLGQ
jgi:hypothetical protein